MFLLVQRKVHWVSSGACRSMEENARALAAWVSVPEFADRLRGHFVQHAQDSRIILG